MIILKQKAIRMYLIAVFCIAFCIFLTGCSEKGLSHYMGITNRQAIQEKTVKITTIDLLSDQNYNTKAYIHQSEIPGPAVMVVGGIHGNEPAGAVAAEKLNALHIAKGTLIVIPRANELALQQNIRTLPEIEDINRAYPGRSDGTPAQKIASSIVALMKKYNVEMVLDLHEGYAFNSENGSSVGETILPGTDDKSTLIAIDAVEYINSYITDPKKKFSVLANPIAGSTAFYANNVLHIPSFTIETSTQQPLEDRVRFHFLLSKFILFQQGIFTDLSEK